MFARVMATNYLSWSELRRLLSPPSVKMRASGTEFISAQSIALKTYAALLGEKQSVLETGFLDTLSFPAAVLNTRGIRRCEACASVGYHCTLFSIRALTHCPWHRTRLTRGCITCAKTIRTAGRRTLRDAAICPACGSLIVDPAWRLSGVMDTEVLQASENGCNTIVEWWRSVCSKERDANELFGDVLGSDDTRFSDNAKQLKWGAIIALARPPGVGMIHDGTPATVLRWPATKRDHVDEGDAWRMLVIRRYRSVRRHIFRRFVRQHRHCLSILTSGERADLYYLDREHACTVCVAFIAWRRALEQSGDAVERVLDKVVQTNAALAQEGVSSSLRTDSSETPSDSSTILNARNLDRQSQRWKLRMPTTNGEGLSAELIPHFLYAEFLRIWMELEVSHIGYNIKVFVDPLGTRPPFLPTMSPVPNDLRTAEPLSAWKVIVPDVEMLMERARERCSRRELHQSSMFNDRPQYNSEGFSWQSLQSFDLLLMLRYHRDGSSRLFRYVCL